MILGIGQGFLGQYQACFGVLDGALIGCEGSLVVVGLLGIVDILFILGNRCLDTGDCCWRGQLYQGYFCRIQRGRRNGALIFEKRVVKLDKHLPDMNGVAFLDVHRKDLPGGFRGNIDLGHFHGAGSGQGGDGGSRWVNKIVPGS